MAQISQSGIYVVLINLPRRTVVEGLVKFRLDGLKLTVREIFQFFEINKSDLVQNYKIWIKRKDLPHCRPEPFKTTSVLEWEYHNECVVVISPLKPDPNVFFNYSTMDPKRNYENKMAEQSRLWEENKKKKIERSVKTPHSIQIRTQARRAVIKRKNRARLNSTRQTQLETEKLVSVEIPASDKKNPDS